MLKTWVVHGMFAMEREAHMKDTWKEVVDLRGNGSLPDMASLDAVAVDDWKGELGVPSIVTLIVLDDVATDELDGRDPDVPEEVHQAMIELFKAGGVPRSTQVQQRRALCGKSMTVSIPPNLTSALRYGYIAPNLKPPRGMRWSFVNGKFSLNVLGG